MSNKAKIILILTIVVFVFVLIKMCLPVSVESGPYEYSVVNGIEYQSDYCPIGKKNVSIFAFLNDNGNNQEFVITEIEKKGIFKNQYEMETFEAVSDESILHPSYEAVSYAPSWGVGTFSKHYGDCYVGIVPASCTQITFDDKQAELQPFSFAYQGQQVKFNLYCCYIESSDWDAVVSEVKAYDENEKVILIESDIN